jgi:hypothetical protein
MPLLEGLVEGFAGAAGAGDVVNRIEAQKQRRQNLSDEALEDAVQMHVDTMKGIQAKLGQNPGDPELTKALSGERDQLFQLLHPSNNPDALGRVKKLFRHVFRQQEPTQKQPINNLPSVASMTAAAPQQPDKFKDFQKIWKEATGKDLPPEQAETWAKKQGGIEEKPTKPKFKREDGTDSAGNPMTIYREEADPSNVVNSAGQNIPEDVLAGWKPALKPPKPETSTEISLESYGNSFDPPVAWKDMKPEQKAFYETWKAMQSEASTVGDRVVIVTKANGDQVPVIMRGVTQKFIHGSGTPAPPGLRSNKPTTPTKPAGQQMKEVGAMKNKLAKNGAGVVSEGAPVGHKNTASQNKAQTELDDAKGLMTTANDVASKPDDAFNQKRLAVALERASAGRFTTQALDYIKKIGWGATIEQWANDTTTGALPTDLIRQMVDGAREWLNAKQAAYNGAFNLSNVPAIGTTDGGYRFIGGNPADKSSWTKVAQ